MTALKIGYVMRHSTQIGHPNVCLSLTASQIYVLANRRLTYHCKAGLCFLEIAQKLRGAVTLIGVTLGQPMPSVIVTRMAYMHEPLTPPLSKLLRSRHRQWKTLLPYRQLNIHPILLIVEDRDKY